MGILQMLQPAIAPPLNQFAKGAIPAPAVSAPAAQSAAPKPLNIAPTAPSPSPVQLPSLPSPVSVPPVYSAPFMQFNSPLPTQSFNMPKVSNTVRLEDLYKAQGNGLTNFEDSTGQLTAPPVFTAPHPLKTLDYYR